MLACVTVITRGVFLCRLGAGLGIKKSEHRWKPNRTNTPKSCSAFGALLHYARKNNNNIFAFAYAMTCPFGNGSYFTAYWDITGITETWIFIEQNNKWSRLRWRKKIFFSLGCKISIEPKLFFLHILKNNFVVSLSLVDFIIVQKIFVKYAINTNLIRLYTWRKVKIFL